MMGLGSGNNGEWTFIDVISLIGFCVGLQNLDLNISQENLDNQTQELDASLRKVVDEIHRHLTVQDQKIDNILEALHDQNKETDRRDS